MHSSAGQVWHRANGGTRIEVREDEVMTNTVTHFEIYGEHPVALADFYRKAFGWQVEQMEGIGYWRIQIGGAEGPALHGGLTYRAIPDLSGWMLFVNVPSLDET